MSADLARRGYHYSAVTAHKYMNTEMKLFPRPSKETGRLQLVRVPDRGGAASDGGRIFLYHIYISAIDNTFIILHKLFCKYKN